MILMNQRVLPRFFHSVLGKQELRGGQRRVVLQATGWRQSAVMMKTMVYLRSTLGNGARQIQGW